MFCFFFFLLFFSFSFNDKEIRIQYLYNNVMNEFYDVSCLSPTNILTNIYTSFYILKKFINYLRNVSRSRRIWFISCSLQVVKYWISSGICPSKYRFWSQLFNCRFFQNNLYTFFQKNQYHFQFITKACTLHSWIERITQSGKNDTKESFY